MSTKVLEVRKDFSGDQLGEYISQLWFNWNSQRRNKIEEWKEVQKYLFATDTSTTSNSTLPWKNSTTLPKLCQIRDNLHSNYISALFPNDDWLKWEAYSKDDAAKEKVEAIESYMSNKTRESGFRSEISRLIYDYIDYGNCFATVEFVSSFRLDKEGKKVINYIGPKIKRISPMDIVFNPIASSFGDTFKVVRSVKNIGELRLQSIQEPDNFYLKEALIKRDKMITHANAFGQEEWDKAEGLQVDGFGNYWEYLQSGFVEILEFFGDIHNQETGTVSTGRVVTVIDRMYVIRNSEIPQWFGQPPIYHAGWRLRPDNLWAMGPLDNLVGMQYRIDHLENLKADAMDLAVMPPLVISGDVEEFKYAPGVEIHMDENGSIQELGHNVQWVLQSNNEIQLLEARMELYAGAPREAMGVRTPGEKTAFEVQTLDNASGRMFQEKINTFEIELLEKALNAMLETAKRNMDMEDWVRVMDNSLGVQRFVKITKDDITASGKLRPIGARHFAAQAQLLQGLNGVFNSPMAGILAPHISGINLSKLLEDVLGLGRYSLFKPNAAVFEKQDTDRMINQAQEDLGAEAAVQPSLGAPQ